MPREVKGNYPETVYNPSFCASIAKCMQPKLHDLDFFMKLDGAHTRRRECLEHCPEGKKK